MNHGLWSFAVALYARPSVAPACLDWQERLGVDVLLLLFAAWRGRDGAAVGTAELDRANALVAPWRARVVLPLRAVRTVLKGEKTFLSDDAKRLRQAVKAAELKAEEIALRTLEQANLGTRSERDMRETILANVLAVHRFCAHIGPSADDRDAAIVIAEAAASLDWSAT